MTSHQSPVTSILLVTGDWQLATNIMNKQYILTREQGIVILIALIFFILFIVNQENVYGGAAIALQKKRAQKGAAAQDQIAIRDAIQTPQAVNRNGQAQTMSMSDIWVTLNTSSEIWPQVEDIHARAACVAYYIEYYRRHRVIMLKPPMHYTQMMDGLSSQNPGFLQYPFKDVFRILAIIEYDYNNGMDKDELAQRVLGNGEAFHANRRRLGLESAPAPGDSMP